MTIGMSTRTEACQIGRKVSQNSLDGKKNLPRGFLCSRRRLTKVQWTTKPDQCGQKYGPKLVKPLKKSEKNNNGKTRSQNSTMLGDCEKFTSLFVMTKITKKLSKNAS